MGVGAAMTASHDFQSSAGGPSGTPYLKGCDEIPGLDRVASSFRDRPWPKIGKHPRIGAGPPPAEPITGREIAPAASPGDRAGGIEFAKRAEGKI
jgi:hypothetical protein